MLLYSSRNFIYYYYIHIITLLTLLLLITLTINTYLFIFNISKQEGKNDNGLEKSSFMKEMRSSMDLASSSSYIIRNHSKTLQQNTFRPSPNKLMEHQKMKKVTSNPILIDTKARIDNSEYVIRLQSNGLISVLGISKTFAEVYVLVSLQTRSLTWKLAKLMENQNVTYNMIEQNVNISLPRICYDDVVNVNIVIRRNVEDVSTAASWNEKNIPNGIHVDNKESTASFTFHASAMIKDQHRDKIETNSWAMSKIHPHWIWLRDIKVDRSHCFEDAFEEVIKRRMERKLIESIPTQMRNIVIIGDSQARTMFETILKLICLDNNSTITKYNGLLEFTGGNSPLGTIQYVSYPGCRAPNFDEDPSCRKSPKIQLSCGGTFEQFDNGCYGGGFKYTLSEKGIILTYVVDIVSNRPLLYDLNSIKTFGNNCALKSSVGNASAIISFLSMHDTSLLNVTESNKNIMNKFSEYLNLFKQKSIGNENQTKLIFASVWSTDPLKRPVPYQLLGSLYRAQLFSAMQKHAVNDFKKMNYVNSAFIDIFQPTLAAMDQTEDGVHLFDGFPRNEIAWRIFDELMKN